MPFTRRSSLDFRPSYPDLSSTQTEACLPFIENAPNGSRAAQLRMSDYASLIRPTGWLFQRLQFCQDIGKSIREKINVLDRVGVVDRPRVYPFDG